MSIYLMHRRLIRIAIWFNFETPSFLLLLQHPDKSSLTYSLLCEYMISSFIKLTAWVGVNGACFISSTLTRLA